MLLSSAPVLGSVAMSAIGWPLRIAARRAPAFWRQLARGDPRFGRLGGSIPARAKSSIFPIAKRAPFPPVRPSAKRAAPAWRVPLPSSPSPNALPADAAALIPLASRKALSAAPAKTTAPEPLRAPKSARPWARHSVQADELSHGSNPNGSLKLIGSPLA